MRTTLTLDDQIAKKLKTLAHSSDTSFKEMVNETLRRGLAATGTLPRAKPYKAPSFAMGTEAGGLNLDKALAIAERLEDEELARKLAMHK